MDRLADDRAIRDLVHRYADAVSRDDDDAWLGTWSEAGVWEVLGRRCEGRDAAFDLYRKLVSNVAFVVQMAYGGLLEVEGDLATGRWTITEHLRFKDGTPGFNVGLYHDRYTRTDEGWRFAERRFQPIYLGPPDLSGPLPHEG